MTVTVRYFAAAAAAAGLEAESLVLLPGATVDDLIRHCADLHGPTLRTVLQRCSYLLDEIAVRDRLVVLRSGQSVDVLPPFAGG